MVCHSLKTKRIFQWGARSSAHWRLAHIIYRSAKNTDGRNAAKSPSEIGCSIELACALPPPKSPVQQNLAQSWTSRQGRQPLRPSKVIMLLEARLPHVRLVTRHVIISAAAMV